MRRFRVVPLVALGVLVIGLGSVALAMKEEPRPLEPPDYAVGRLPVSGPFVIVQQGGTTWVQPYPDTTHCPGDPLEGHGGEATGGPDGSQTWCFQDAVWPEDFDPTNNGELVTTSDTCGTLAPWDTQCWTTVDVRGLPSQTGLNFWHIDTWMGVNGGEVYNGFHCLWCGSDSLWIDGTPVECNIWAKGKKPGYGNQWHCVVQLDLAGWTTIGTCTLAFDPRYDLECKYDYFYVDYYDGTEWQNLALFNGSSNSDTQICVDPSSANPDWWGFGDTGQGGPPPGTFTADWVTRTVGGQPAFFIEIDGASLPEDTLSFRWRVTTDGAWSDADGRGDTDGAAQVDNVLVQVDGQYYFEDFELGSVGPEWSFPNPDGVAQLWHQEHDPDRPYEGGDGDVQTTCTLDSSVVYRGRPKQGYAAGEPWRNAWFYRLKAPKAKIPPGVTGTGCVVQYDQYMCALDYTCDYTNTHVRFYNTTYEKWCPWIDIDGFILYGGCFFWNFDREEDVTKFYGDTADSMQFSWCLLDVSNPGDFCEGKHKWTDNLVDNVSIGFYDGTATQFQARSIDILQDSFHDSVCAFNSLFTPSTYETDSLDKYAGPPYVPTIPKDEQLYVSIGDKDLIQEIRLYGSIDGGQTWIYNDITANQEEPSDPDNPALGGDYYGTFCPDDFPPQTRWAKGTEVFYYVRVEDQIGNIEYWPNDADPNDPDHTGTREDYFTFSIMPMFPIDYDGTKILLVDGYGRTNYDYTECMAQIDERIPLEDMYEQTLIDAGYCYDKYDISGAGSNVHIHPIEFVTAGQDSPYIPPQKIYDAVVWFTGPYFSNYLFDKQAQIAIQSYMNQGGKVVLCGDRIAYNMAVVGEDSLGGEFLNGIMGCDYIEEMEGAFDKPYIYIEAADTIQTGSGPVPIPMDSLLAYRECPYLKDMSYVIASAAPDSGYTAQSFLYTLNPAPTADPSDMGIYVEKPVEGGQCVFINYDLSAQVTHTATYCDGSTPAGVPTFAPGYYYGRVDLMRTILEDLFNLTPPFPGGGGGTSDLPKQTQFRWALGQNMPNPVASTTEIRFEVARTSNVSIKVYNAMGQLVRTLRNERMQPGRYSVHWDGTNRTGEKVSSGVYFYKMDAGKFRATHKMLIIK
jgi:hypothetical protein